MATPGKDLPRSAIINLADVSRATRAANSTVAPSSIGTATAPRSKHPQNAAIHSAPLGPHRITRSPVRMPFSRNNPAHETATLANCA
jgi:hypothetical protein